MDAILELQKVGDIKGNFFIPSYQRGYRWGENEVIRLLDDIYQNEEANYCLQPIVVRKDGEQYRVIDGQQRLTTIFLIYKYMNQESNSFIEPPAFNISYETRPKSREFLESSSEEMMEKSNENVDFWFIAHNYQTIGKWFNDDKKGKKSDLMTEINKRLNNSVNVIWYEIGEDEDERKLFTRLNIGKIPLTSAELTKAMFLSKSGSRQITREKQEEIALQWDNIEKELNEKSLWFFLTNDSEKNYQTRIDLVLDLVSEKNQSNEPYHTFFYFDKQRKEEPLENVWQNIYRTFFLFKDWHEDHTLYHKIGYLISTGTETLSSIYQLSINQTKRAFKNSLDRRIRESIQTNHSFDELSYEHDYELIQRILLLFNVESVRKNGEQTQWFPFDKYKQQNWSLEHIHARRSDFSYKKEVWLEWLELHLESLKLVSSSNPQENDNELINEVENILEKGNLERDKFESIQKEIIDKLSSESEEEYVHTIGNMALLNTSDNSALSNSAFDVKRNKIIDMDQHGKFIPFCTKMVFLKYYSSSDETQIHFWSDKDRHNYISHIIQILANYLPESELQNVR